MKTAPIVGWLALAAGCAGSTSRTQTAPPPLPDESRAHVDAADAAVVATTDAAAPEAPAPTPIPATLPTIAAESVPGVQHCDRGTCAIQGLGTSDDHSIVAAFEGEVPHVVGWLELIRPGATVHYPRREGVDLLGVVVAGEASLGLAEQPASRATHAGAWTGFYLPSGGASIRAAGNAPVLVALAGAGEPMRARPNIGDERGPRAAGAGWVLRPLASVDDRAWAGGAYHARVAFAPPASPSASLTVLMAGPDAPLAEASNADAWEVLLVLSAAGRLRIPAQPMAGGDGGVAPGNVALSPGSVAFIPPGVRHSYSPSGGSPLVAVQLFAPPGPEQRYADAGAR